MNVLCVLARVPAPGVGKSRLRGRFGDAAVDTLAAAFLADVLSWPARAADAMLLAHAGPVARLARRYPRLLLVAQAEGDLGDRIAAAVDAAFDRGATRVVVVGSDCPTLPERLVEAAFSGLATSSSTLVPAHDGGWIALGVVRPLGSALAGVEWSTSATFAQTAAALARDGRPPALLAPWYDIDEPADVDRFLGEATAATRAPRTSVAIAALAATMA